MNSFKTPYNTHKSGSANNPNSFGDNNSFNTNNSHSNNNSLRADKVNINITETGNNTDKGIRKAAKTLSSPRLASNFSYNMMRKINEEVLLREKRREKRNERITIAAIITLSIGMIVICERIIRTYLGEQFDERFRNTYSGIWKDFFANSFNMNQIFSDTFNSIYKGISKLLPYGLSENLDFISNIGFFMPVIVALVIIFMLNRWVRKKYGYLLE